MTQPKLSKLIKEEADAMKCFRRKFITTGIPSISDFLCKFGIEFGKVLEFRRGEGLPKQCYNNSFELAQEFSINDRLIYCEGLATGPKVGWLPINHAWCVNHHGFVVDVTTRNLEQYVGVPFRLETIAKHYKKNKYCSLIDDWENGFPLLHMSDEEIVQLLHPLVASFYEKD